MSGAPLGVSHAAQQAAWRRIWDTLLAEPVNEQSRIAGARRPDRGASSELSAPAGPTEAVTAVLASAAERRAAAGQTTDSAAR